MGHLASRYRICPIDDIGDIGAETELGRMPDRRGRGFVTDVSRGAGGWLKARGGAGGRAPERSDSGCGNVSTSRGGVGVSEGKGEGSIVSGAPHPAHECGPNRPLAAWPAATPDLIS